MAGAVSGMIALGLIRFAAAFVMGVILLAPDSSRSAEQMFAGMWFMEGVEHGVFAQFIYDRRANGTFSARIRTLEECTLVRAWTEAGTWTYKAGAIEQATTMVEGGVTHFHDIFRVLFQAPNEVRVVDVETKIRWRLLRVNADFQFPPPSNCPAV